MDFTKEFFNRIMEELFGKTGSGLQRNVMCQGVYSDVIEHLSPI